MRKEQAMVMLFKKICIEYSETMTKPNQEEKIDEKINKYGKEEANRNGDVGQNISCSSIDYPNYRDTYSTQGPKIKIKLYSKYKTSIIGKVNNDRLEEPEDVFTEDIRRKLLPTTERECSEQSTHKVDFLE